MARGHREHEYESETGGSQSLLALGSLAVGAGLMYVMDPSRGNRRRAIMRDKMTRTANRTGTALRKAGDDLRHRSRGMFAEAWKSMRPEHVSDEKLCARVRSAMGRVVSHPDSIQVDANNGVVTLRGPILADEFDDLMWTVWRVRGVNEILNGLDLHQTAGDVPGLQGQPRPRFSRYDILQENWAPATRLMVGALGATVAAAGAAKRDTAGLVMGLLGGGMLARAFMNVPTRRLTGVGAGRRAVDVQKDITINAPLEMVFDFFAHFENFPHFMHNVREVRVHESGRSHWEVSGPAGMTVRWDADVTEFIPNEVIAWKTVPRSVVENAGIIRFEQKPEGTRVDIKMSYNPPAGALGHALAKVFGADPKSEMDQDLMRVKTTLESGNPPHDAARPLQEAESRRS